MAESQGKHTPGPCGDRHEIDRAYSEAHERIRNAAPDLLKALEAAYPMLEAHERSGCDCPDSEASRMARAAIAKARGA